MIDAGAPAKADEVLGLLIKSIDRFPLENLHAVMSPAAAMTGWLAADEAPASFTIDQDTELRSTGERRATVRYVRHRSTPTTSAATSRPASNAPGWP